MGGSWGFRFQGKGLHCDIFLDSMTGWRGMWLGLSFREVSRVGWMMGEGMVDWWISELMWCAFTMLTLQSRLPLLRNNMAPERSTGRICGMSWDLMNFRQGSLKQSCWLHPGGKFSALRKIWLPLVEMVVSKTTAGDNPFLWSNFKVWSSWRERISGMATGGALRDGSLTTDSVLAFQVVVCKETRFT